MSGLSVEILLQRGALRLQVGFEVAAGETVVVVGPNGAGKSSCLLAIAGLVPIEVGRIALGSRCLDDGSGRGFVPAERRDIGVVFQSHLLLPHLSAVDNVAYGLRARGRSRREARETARSWLERVGIGSGLVDARPAVLSGGQSQRVALARALAIDPAVLLLDEPMAAVDASGRLALRRELRDHLASFAGPRLLVAHDLADAFALADRVLVLEEGRLVQAGPIDELVARPRSRYVADLVGVNCFRGVARAGVVTVAGAPLRIASTLEGEVLVTLHPRAVSLFRQQPAGSPRNVWAAPIEALEPTLERVRVRLGGPIPLVAEVTHAAVEELRLEELRLDGGGEVFVAIKATELNVTPA